MPDLIDLDIRQSVKAKSGIWYKNLVELGKGGNASVYLVVATSGPNKGIPFAMKIFRRLSKPEWRDSFLQEIEFLATCNHPSIMRVFDDGVFYEKHPFVVEEYLPSTLRSVIAADSASVAAKASYVLQLLSALDYLSKRNPAVVHRDIKPENVFLKGHSCVLGDFGLIKSVDAEGQQDQEMVKESLGYGMPWRYRTPDLIDYLLNAKPPTCKSDVYQLGLVAAELFTGTNPQCPPRIISEPIKLNPLGPIRTALAAGVANLINRMLLDNPQDRDSASKLLDPWQGVFLEAAKRTQALEGKVF